MWGGLGKPRSPSRAGSTIAFGGLTGPDRPFRLAPFFRGRQGRQLLVALLLLALVGLGSHLPFGWASALRQQAERLISLDTDWGAAWETLRTVRPSARYGDAIAQWLDRLAPPRDAGAGGRPDAALPALSEPGVSGAARHRFVNPVPVEVARPFGWDGQGRYHPGIDIAAPRNTAVRAAAAGTVRRVGLDPAGYGRYLILDHGDGWETLYAQLAAVLVAPGESVGAGERIGRVGSSGDAHEPHLHFEVRVDGREIDPFPYLPAKREP